MAEMQIRKSVFAGKFYPSTQQLITRKLDELKERAGAQERAARPPILIVPHAAWQYSGLAAVRGIMTLASSPPSRVVLIGPAHRHYFLGFSLSGYGKYLTPLGEIEVDLVLQKEISDLTGFHFVPEAHVYEHSLEVIIPMIQYIVPAVRKILPILAGDVTGPAIDSLADALASLMDPLQDTLIVSSDLSHFYSYDEARSLDQDTLERILEGNRKALLERSGEGGRLACGFAGIATAIEVARRWELDKPELLMYYNSGDSGGDMDSVVGYASLAYPPPNLAASD